MDEIRYRLVVADDGNWAQYSNLCATQWGYVPLRTDKVLLVCGLESYDIICGCVLICTDGPYLLANGIVVNGRFGKEEQYNAAMYLQHQLRELAAVLGRTVLLLTSHAGMTGVAQKLGYTQLPAQVWFYSHTASYIAPSYVKADTGYQELTGGDIEFEDILEVTEPAEPKRGRGRPKGSKNKKKHERKRRRQDDES